MHNALYLAAVISAIATVLMTALLTMIAKLLREIRSTVKRFMSEHLYLLRVTDWGKVNLGTVMDHLGITPTEPPPENPLKIGR
jgi:hypothetical protein